MLLTVAAEIRLTIYNFLFEDSVVHIHFDYCTNCKDAVEEFCGKRRASKVNTDRFRSAITKACRQVRKESLHLLLRKTRLHVYDAASSAAESHSTMSAIPPLLLDNITHITTDVISRLNGDLLARCPNLQHLDLHRCAYSSVPRRSSDSDKDLVRAFLRAVAVKKDYTFVRHLLHTTKPHNLSILCEVYFVTDVFAANSPRLVSLECMCHRVEIVINAN